jgi:hypothetical protein
VWKYNFEFRHETLAHAGRQERWAQTGKREPSGIPGCYSDVAVGTDDRRWSFARKELRAMTVETSLVLREISHVRKRIVAFANLFPVFRGKFVARVAIEFLLLDVRAMRELRIVNARLWRSPALRYGGTVAQQNKQTSRCAEHQQRSCCW